MTFSFLYFHLFYIYMEELLVLYSVEQDHKHNKRRLALTPKIGQRELAKLQCRVKQNLLLASSQGMKHLFKIVKIKREDHMRTLMCSRIPCL